MSRVTKVQQVAEAVCGALYRVDWQPLGDSDEGASTWFIRGIKPKQVRIEVQRSKLAHVVNVNVEWFNISVPGRFVRGRKTYTINCDASVPDTEVFEKTELTVLGCLEIMKNVIAEDGVAGRSYVENTAT